MLESIRMVIRRNRREQMLNCLANDLGSEMESGRPSVGGANRSRFRRFDFARVFCSFFFFFFTVRPLWSTRLKYLVAEERGPRGIERLSEKKN